MRGPSFVFILLFLKAQASFLDDIRGAVSNINQGFGKLIGDVVSDVKDTFYCTVSAVEQVLVRNGLLNQRTQYNQRCKGTEKPKEQDLNHRDDTRTKTVSKIQKHSVIHHKHSSRRISHESEHSIKNVSKSIINALDKHNTDGKIAPDKDKFDANHLAEISKIIKQESENISENVKNEIKKMQFANNKSPVESILEEFQLLNDVRRNSKNDTEVSEIRRIFDKVIDQMHLKINSQQMLEKPELEKLKEELLKYGKSNSTTEKQSPQGTSQDLLSIKLKDSKTNSTITFKDVALKIYNKEEIHRKTVVKEHKQKQDSQSKSVKAEESIFSLGLDSISSFFKSTTVNPDDLNNAKKIVEDSQHSEKVLNNLFKG
ncbi:repetitive organellar protein-like [Maniola hyperantus]|uniref:repetitive organellar protein-like n=1 Tax=Aphantopus hyperantus TaxID=2795564 RepID=UPI001569FBA4|nr:uncharacterized protein PFB0145c-like [Maniola hyperantus]